MANNFQFVLRAKISFEKNHILHYFIFRLSGDVTILYKFVLSEEERFPQFAMVISDHNRFPEPFESLSSRDASDCKGFVGKKFFNLVKCLPVGDFIELLVKTPKSYMSLDIVPYNN